VIGIAAAVVVTYFVLRLVASIILLALQFKIRRQERSEEKIKLEKVEQIRALSGTSLNSKSLWPSIVFTLLRTVTGAVYFVLDADYNKYMDIQQAVNLRILEEFQKHQISFALPTQKMLLSNGLQPEEADR
jgi:hypothetical protein